MKLNNNYIQLNYTTITTTSQINIYVLWKRTNELNFEKFRVWLQRADQGVAKVMLTSLCPERFQIEAFDN